MIHTTGTTGIMILSILIRPIIPAPGIGIGVSTAHIPMDGTGLILAHGTAGIRTATTTVGTLTVTTTIGIIGTVLTMDIHPGPIHTIIVTTLATGNEEIHIQML